MISEKQLAANRQNALKSTGPKTQAGKALASRNSLKHGLLAKNVVITEGEGAEDQQAFDALLADFIGEFNPVGSLEEMLVEKIAVCYWRMSRANRYEVGVLRQHLDTATDDYYKKSHDTDAQIDDKILECQQALKNWQYDLDKLSQLFEKEASLEEIYTDDEIWDGLSETYSYLLIGATDYSPRGIKDALTRKGFTNMQIWQLLIESCQKQFDRAKTMIPKLQKDKTQNRLRLSALKQRGSLPPKSEMDNLLRYETAIERQLYKAISQLERCQRQRIGDYVPPPAQVDLNIDGLKTGT